MLRGLRQKIKKRLFERWNLQHSPIPGLPHCIYRYFRSHGPITLIDIGAHRGQFTLAVQQLCGVSSAIMVEPIEELATRLRLEFDGKIYKVFDCAIADQAGESTMQIFPNALYVSSLLTPDYSIEDMKIQTKGDYISVKRRTRTLDEIAAEVQLNAVDLIKIDVQGGEHLVIAGASRSLRNATAVYTEVSFRSLYHGSSLFSDVHAMMTERGFFLAALEPAYATEAGELLQADALFVNRSV